MRNWSEMKNKTLMTSIKQVVQAYHSREFKVQAILAVRQFKHLQQLIEQKGITLNICSTNQHVLEIERDLSQVKETARSIAATLPFERYPPQLIIEMVFNCVFWLKSFPHKDCVHVTKIPREIMMGQSGTRDIHTGR